MAKISTYPILSTPSINDLLIGTDVDNLNITKNFSIGDIASFIIGGSYVPYVGATGNVNLGAFNITSSSFIIGGGLSTQFLKANGTLDSTVYQPAGNYITQLSGEATGSGPGNASVTLSNSAVINKVLTGLTITGNAIVATDSILTAFGKVQNQINTLVGGVQYKGTWNAATNVPALVSSVGVSGNYYVVSVAGNTNLNGITDWNLGDWAIFNGSAWEKVDNTDAVISVNGQVGAVVLTTTNISEGTNLYFTNSRARTAINLTTTGNSGAATYNNTNGFFNIPEYTLAGLSGVPLTRQLTINGTAFDLSANRSWNVGTVTSVGTSAPLTGGTITGSGTIGITQATSSTDGYLSSTDWTTFNSKQNAITNPVTGTGTAFFLPMWASASSLINSPLSYASDAFTFGYNSATGGTVTFTNSGLTAYAYTIQMNNFGSPRSTIHSYTDGVVVQSISGTQVSRIFANGNTLLGIGLVDNGNKLEIEGSLKVNTIDNATTDTDRFLVSDSGVIKYRTGTELRSDIGAGVGSVTSVALTMPSAFSVANSPVTGSGTLAVTGAGVASQYVRGDGTLADFPTTTGGGSSVSYYLNGSVSQGTIGGVAYRELSEIPIFGAGTDISIAADGYIASFITDAGDPALLNIPAGNWNFETYFSASSGGGTPSFYVELYRYDGTTFTLIASSSSVPELISFGTNIQPYFSTLAVPQTALALTDRLAIRYYVVTSGRTITLHTEDNHLCQVVTTFSHGLTALNGLTEQVQYFQVGTAGTDFNIVSSVATHTFNLPDASASNRGLVTTGTQTFAGQKTFLTATRFDKYIRLKHDNFLDHVTGYSTIGSNADNFFLAASNDKYAVLNVGNITSQKTYTLPDASGTLALTSDLGSYVPYSGATGAVNLGVHSLSASQININGNAPTSGSYLGFKHSTSVNTGTEGYTSMYTFGTTIIGYKSVSGATNRDFSFSMASITPNVSGGRVYTLPDASGTLALTSQLDGYVTLGTAQTITGQKTFNSTIVGQDATLTSSGSNPTLLVTHSSGSGIALDISKGGNGEGLRVTKTSGSGNAVTITGGLLSAEAATLTGALNGTSATFSGLLTRNSTGVNQAVKITTSGTAGFNAITIEDSNPAITDFGVIGVTSTANKWFLGWQASPGTLGNTALTWDKTGAIGVTSSVTTGGRVHLIADNNTASVRLQNNAANKVWELNPSNPDISNSGFTIWNVTDNTKPFHITDGGNVGIGTAFPVHKLHVEGSTAIATTGTEDILILGRALGGGASFQQAASLKLGRYQDAGGNFESYTRLDFALRDNSAASNYNTNTTVMTLTNAGNVGIGTTSPADRLIVNGNLGITDGSFASGESYSLYLGDKNAFINSTFGQRVRLGAFNGFDFGFAQNGDLSLSSTWMSINGSGNVGIGTDSISSFYGFARTLSVEDASSAEIQLKATGGTNTLASFGAATTGTFIQSATQPLITVVNAAERMRITSAGNVGIGTASPNTRLEVSDVTSKLRLTSTTGGGNSALEWYVLTSYIGDITSSSGSGAMTFNQGPSAGWGGLIIFKTDTSERMRIKASGGVVINNLGTGLVYSSSGELTSVNPSDERLKDNIEEINWGLEEILKLRPVSYTWKNDTINQGTQFGFIAQEVQEVMPEAVKEFGEEEQYLGLEKEAIYVTLVKAIQELKTEIDSLKNQIK